MYKHLLIAFLLVLSLSVFCQNTIGLPDIINYSKQAYTAGTQNWDIRQDSNGIVYFANNEGVLSFDGTYWKLYPLPNKTIARSLEIGEDNRIYVGAQNELGYFSPDKNGRLAYTSLKPLIPKNESSFADVWEVILFGSDVFFRASHKIFQYNSHSIKVHKAPMEWRFMGAGYKQLIAQDWKTGLFFFDRGNWKTLVQQSDLPIDFLVTATIPVGVDSTLITTLKNGIYLLHNNHLSKIQSPNQVLFSNERIYSAVAVNEQWIALATTLSGCYIINKKGEIIQSFARAEGLQNNNILSLFLDRDNNLWLGLDNGIDFIAYNSPVKHVYPVNQDEGSGYTSLIHKNKLYIGTSNGLFNVPVDNSKDLSFVKGKFEKVINSNGQVWNLSAINGNLFMGHHEGAFEVVNNEVKQIDNSSGFWGFIPYNNNLVNPIVIAGNYSGLNFFQYQQGRLAKTNLQAEFESARFIIIDENNTIWVSHPYKGIYKIEHNQAGVKTIKRYTDSNGLTAHNNYVFKIKNRLVISTEKGMVEYDAATDRFRPSAFFKNIFGDVGVVYLKEDPSGNIWFVHGKKLGVVDFTGKKPQIIYFAELNNKLVNGFEHVYPLNNNNIFVGAEKGFFHINYEKYKHSIHKFSVQIRSVKIINKTDSLIFGGYTNTAAKLKEAIPEINNNWNSLRFEFSSTMFSQQSNMEYSFYLKGFDESWSAWSKRTEKEYTNLPAGSYTFQIKARNNLGSESAVSLYRFNILPPWYQTGWAYLGYTIMLFAFIYFLYELLRKKFHNQRLKHEQEQKRLQYLHQLEIDKTEKEIVKLKNEKLEAEIGHKNTELASSAMHLVQKGELLAKIKSELMRILKSLDNEKAIEEFKKMIKILNEEDKMDKDWEHFAHHFDKVHSDFLIVMKNLYPNLSANELKLCAYLRMNLSSKEIAQLMNISLRGVEISRYRLRKKLQIPTDTNLFNHLLNIYSIKPASKPSSTQSIESKTEV